MLFVLHAILPCNYRAGIVTENIGNPGLNALLCHGEYTLLEQSVNMKQRKQSGVITNTCAETLYHVSPFIYTGALFICAMRVPISCDT